eukprot:1606583-Pleurochrysis_carterae.AAC.2
MKGSIACVSLCALRLRDRGHLADKVSLVDGDHLDGHHGARQQRHLRDAHRVVDIRRVELRPADGVVACEWRGVSGLE